MLSQCVLDCTHPLSATCRLSLRFSSRSSTESYTFSLGGMVILKRGIARGRNTLSCSTHGCRLVPPPTTHLPTDSPAGLRAPAAPAPAPAASTSRPSRIHRSGLPAAASLARPQRSAQGSGAAARGGSAVRRGLGGPDAWPSSLLYSSLHLCLCHATNTFFSLLWDSTHCRPPHRIPRLLYW